LSEAPPPSASSGASARLRQSAQELAAHLPPLLAEAQKLAASVVGGAHGRRQAGQGEEFWQFRAALPGDPRRNIDWRRSARSDAHFIRQREWQAAQSVFLWLDQGQSMTFRGEPGRQSKAERANLLGIALAILLVRAGERVALMEDPEPARSGQTQLDRLIAQLSVREGTDDYATPPDRVFPRAGRAVFLSDFLGNAEVVNTRVCQAADRGVSGALVQVLDPIEEVFPFDGRTEFRSMTGAVRFETLRARGLQNAYLDKLNRRKAELQSLASRCGWQYRCHHTANPALPELLWLYSTLEARR